MYQVIARKYRPQSFADLVNQEHIKRTLSNAIEQHRIAHGYIFSGQRGTGKTTVARIMARCLNCVEGPTMSPCGKCSSCIEVSAGNSVDVIEIDAASNRGINEMRELRESVRFRPARDKYKVFIIDEAHQITNDAFNALLKTLEEPPEWVVFMLCTTEAHKLPATISSRCQHFSFRSVEMDELIARMQWICSQERIEADLEALTVIAQAGGGSVRDSLSALDQAIASCGNTLNAEQVRFLMGAYSLDTLAKVTDALANENGQIMLELVDELERTGQNLQHFCREISAYFRNLLVAKVAGGNPRLIPVSPKEVERLIEISQQFSEKDLTRYLNVMLDVFGHLQHSLQPRFHLELGLLRLIHAGRMGTVEQAISELRRSGGSEAPGGSGLPRGSELSRSGASTTAQGSVPGQGGGAGSPGGQLGRPTSSASGPPASSGMAASPPPLTGSGGTARVGVTGFRNLSANLATAATSLAPPRSEASAPPVSNPEPASASRPGEMSVPEAQPCAPELAAPSPRRLEVHPGGRDRMSGVQPAESAQRAGAEQSSATDLDEPESPIQASSEIEGGNDTLQERLISVLNETGKRFTADAVERARVTVNSLPNGGSEVAILAPRDTSLSVKEADIREALKQVGIPIQRVKLEFGDVGTQSATRAPKVSADEAAMRAEAEADPDVQYIRELFHGTITRVRSLRT